MKATVKVTEDRGELFVVSLQWARPKELRRLTRRGSLIWGQLLGALAAFIASDEAEEEGDGEA